MAALADIPPAHHYYISGPLYRANIAKDAPIAEISSDADVASDDELIADWVVEQRDLVLDYNYVSLIDEITTYGASNSLLATSADQINWSITTFGKVLNKILPSQIIVKDYTSLMLKLIDVAYSEKKLQSSDSKMRWVQSQFKFLLICSINMRQLPSNYKKEMTLFLALKKP